MRFADELREPDQFELASKASHAKINKGEMQMATTLIKSMSMEWDPKSFHDEYRDKLRDWIKQRAKSGVAAPPPEEEEENFPATYSIMDLLKKSVQETKRPAKPRARRKAG
jgi:DNA end-binding protein Ku